MPVLDTTPKRLDARESTRSPSPTRSGVGAGRFGAGRAKLGAGLSRPMSAGVLGKEREREMSPERERSRWPRTKPPSEPANVPAHKRPWGSRGAVSEVAPTEFDEEEEEEGARKVGIWSGRSRLLGELKGGRGR